MDRSQMRGLDGSGMFGTHVLHPGASTFNSFLWLLLLSMVKYHLSCAKLWFIPLICTLYFLLFVLFVSLMFPCKHCHDGFNALSTKGLKLHQKTCQAFIKHEAAANERRKANATSTKNKQITLKERKERLPSTTPGVSFLAIGKKKLQLIVLYWFIRQALPHKQAQAI